MESNKSFLGMGQKAMAEGATIESADSDETVALTEGKDVAQESIKHQGLVAFVEGRYRRSKDAREPDERRWLQAFQNFRGVYGQEVQFMETEKSRAFIKITKTKVLAAFAQVMNILFSGNKFPIGVEPSPVPDGIAESVHIDPKDPEAQMAQMQGAGGGAPMAPTARPDILDKLGPMRKTLEKVKDKVKDGPGLTPSALTWEPAKMAAKKMEKQFQDQLFESHAEKHLREFGFELCLFGHGVFKGPFAKDKEYSKWSETGDYIPTIKTVADFNSVSIWNSYPDPDATNIPDSEFFIERHKMTKSGLRALKKRPHFRAKSIDLAIAEGYNYTQEYWEDALNDNKGLDEIQRYEVLEYWGNADSDFEEFTDLEIPKQFKGKDQVQVNIWICNGHILRVVFNPFTPARIPYHACPYELNPYSFFGIGVAENMMDTQLLMNGFIRMAVDNAVLSSNLIFEVNETNLVPGQDLRMYPGKVIRTEGQLGTSLNSVKFDNVTQECLMMFDKARQLADESTGIPSYAHGQGGVQGIGRTASGMSMLMGAAAQNIKEVVRNIDDYLLVPLAQALFAFNMQFNFDKDFIGDLQVVARGTESLMRNEVRSQKLMQFMQITGNPMDAPFVKRDYILRELAESLDLEADKVVNDPREAGLQAMQMQELMKAQGIDPNKQQPGGGQAAAPGVGDPTGTGGGNIAPGAAPTPGEQGFSGSPRGGGSGNQPQRSAR